MAFSFKHFKQILDDWLSYVVGHSDFTDINPGSNIRTLGEATAIELAQVYVQVQALLNLFSLDKASGEDLDERALDYGATRVQPTRSTVPLVFGDSNLTSTDTAVSTTVAPLIAGVSMQVQVADYTDFPASGVLILDRDDPTMRENVAWTSKTVPDLLNLSAPPLSNHTTGGTVHRSTVGFDRTIPLGNTVKTVLPNELKFDTVEVATLKDGDYQVSDVLARSQSSGSEYNVAAGRLTVLESSPFPSATVINNDLATGGGDLESDEDFRARIKNDEQARSSSTALRIETEALKVKIDSTGQRVITAKDVEPISPGMSTLYINDGTASYSPSTVSLAQSETLISVAETGQVRSGLKNWPLVSGTERIFVSLERGSSTSVGVGFIEDTTRAWTPSAASVGNITVVTGAQLIDGEKVTLIDALGTTKSFEFDSNGSVTAGNIPVTFTAGYTATQVRDALINAIIGVASFYITPSAGGAALVSLVQDFHGVSGNTPIVETVADAGFTVTNFNGGGDGDWAQFRAKDENDVIYDIFGNTADTLLLNTVYSPSPGAYAIFNPTSTTFPTGSLMVSGVDYIINITNGQFELTAASFPAGLVSGDCLVAYYNGVTAPYVYYDGLLQEVQRIINGDPNDRENYPGVKAAGGTVLVTVPGTVTAVIVAVMSAWEGYDEATLRDLVKAAIVNYINNLKIGDDVIRSKIIEVAMAVTGVKDFQIISPTANIVITDSQLAKTTLTNITVS